MGDKITFGNVTGSTVAAGRGARATSVSTDGTQAVAELQRALANLDRKLGQEPERAEVDVVLATSAALRAALEEPQLDREKGRRRWQAFTTAVMTLASATTIAVNVDLNQMASYAQALGLL